MQIYSEPVPKTLQTGGRINKKSWTEQQPGYHDRTVMLKRCGKKCFLGANKTFPICTKNTCKRNKKGVYAAYKRAREYMTISGTSKYNRISTKARKLLHIQTRKRRQLRKTI